MEKRQKSVQNDKLFHMNIVKNLQKLLQRIHWPNYSVNKANSRKETAHRKC